MSGQRPLLLAVTLVVLAVAPALAQPLPADHAEGELECSACHTGMHRGVQRMFEGVSGRGVPPIPARMFQTRVQCVACHTTPRSAQASVEIIGQTFRPDDAACLKYHGERYCGLIDHWRTSLVAMREAVAAKAGAARVAVSASGPGAKATRARKLLEDAEYNLRFVALANGLHNPFYAGRLLDRAGNRFDEARATVAGR